MQFDNRLAHTDNVNALGEVRKLALACYLVCRYYGTRHRDDLDVGRLRGDDDDLVGLSVGTEVLCCDSFVGYREAVGIIYLHINIAMDIVNPEVFANRIKLHFLIFAVCAVTPEDAVVTIVSYTVFFVPDSEAATSFLVLLVVAREEFKTQLVIEFFGFAIV